MYDDRYRNRFSTVAAATYSSEIHIPDCKGNVMCTHIHNHRDIEMLVIKKGKACFDVDGCGFWAEEGDVVFVNPYEVHSARTTAEGMPFSYYCITFDASMLLAAPTHPVTEMCQKLTDGYMKFDHWIQNEEIYSMLLNTEEIFTKKTEGWEFFLTAELFRIFGTLMNGKMYTLTGGNKKKYIFIKEVLEYIESHFAENITSGDVAEKLSYDKSYFCRLFRRNFRQSFSEYLNFYRINHATELLRKGSSVAEAAISSGFNNLSYFTKLYKQQNQKLPSKIGK